MSPSRSYFSISVAPARRWECPIRAHRPLTAVSLSWATRAFALPSRLLRSVPPPRGQRGGGGGGGGGGGWDASPRGARRGAALRKRRPLVGPEPGCAAGTRLRGRNPIARPEPGCAVARPGERVGRGTGRRGGGGRAVKLERRWRRRPEAGAGAEAGVGAARPAGRQAAAARGSSPDTGAATMAESIVSGAAGREGAGMRQQICRRGLRRGPTARPPLHGPAGWLGSRPPLFSSSRPRPTGEAGPSAGRGLCRPFHSWSRGSRLEGLQFLGARATIPSRLLSCLLPSPQ